MHNTIIIISAFRSGSNLVKDALCKIPGFGTWPSENISFIWRHGNALRKDDELSDTDANSMVKVYIRKAFTKLSRRKNLKYIVEKTEGNSLRVNFVNRIFPEAKFIFVTRDGRDAIASMLNRRKKPIDPIFLLKKVRYLPISDLPIVAIRYLSNLYRKVFCKKKYVYQLGPIFKDMDRLSSSHSEAEMVALQWARCVDKAYFDLSKIDKNRVHTVKYEDFVNNPGEELLSMIRYLNYGMQGDEIEELVKNIISADLGKETASPEMMDIKGISNSSVGRWNRQLNDNTVNLIMPLIESTMRRIGYL